MKGWIFVPIALLLGLVVGSWGPRSDLRTARQDLETARKAAKENSRHRGDIDGITRLIGIDELGKAGGKGKPGSKPGAAARRPGRAAAGETNAPASDDAGATPGVSDVVVPDGAAAADPATNRPAGLLDDPADQRPLKDRIDEAIELWKARSDIARSALLSNLELSPDQATQFDVTVAAMNLRIGSSLQNLADNLKTNQNLNTESAVRVANDITGAMVLGYKELDRTLPQDWRQKAGREFALTDFVDPNVARPLIGVEDKLQDPGQPEPQRRRPGGPRGHRRGGELQLE